MAIHAVATPRGMDLLMPSAAFVASASLFAIELFAGKLLLPLFGGAPGVWISCLAFFQVALVAAYFFSDLVARLDDPRRQVVSLATLFAAAAVMTPMVAPTGLAMAANAHVPKPVAVIIALALTVGPVFFAIATLAPLFGHWRGLVGAGAYSLYAAGNAGSFSALLAYPWLVEPAFGLSVQVRILVTLFLAVAVLAVAAGCRVCRLIGHRTGKETVPRSAVGWSRWLRWVAIAAIPSSWLASITTYATTEIAPLPLLWVVPLAIYIGSFVIVFSSWGRRLRRFEPTLLFAATVLVVVMVGCEIEEPLFPVLVLHGGIFAIVCLCLHGMLVDDRPDASSLTTMYLALAVGGACGGLFNAVVAPAVFDAHYEFPLAIAATAAIVPMPRRTRAVWCRLAAIGGSAVLIAFGGGMVPILPASPLGWLGTTIVASLVILSTLAGVERGAAVLAALLTAFWMGEADIDVVHRTRTFFGVLRVTESDNGPSRTLSHGSISHGVQLVSRNVDRRDIPLTYYHRAGPLGSIFQAMQRLGGCTRVGVAGLGVGTIAAYAEAGQEFTFFEIDPAVVHIATDPRWFTFVSDCRGRTRIVVDDARLALERESDDSFDLLVVDAFTGDSVPTHLLTREAFALYGRKVAPGGVIAMHVSNKYLDLAPMIEALATEDGWMALYGCDLTLLPGSARHGSQWIAISRSLDAMKTVYAHPTSDLWQWTPLAGPATTRPWTDDWSPVVTCLKR